MGKVAKSKSPDTSRSRLVEQFEVDLENWTGS